MADIIKIVDMNKKRVDEIIKEGNVIIYPTDTSYSWGCNAMDNNAVTKIRGIKKSNKPFSVIAPSKQWIYRNLEANKIYVQKLPGPFTFIFRIKRPNIVSGNVTNMNFLGIRIPDHPFIELLQKTKIPFLTTSISEKKVIRDIKDIPRKVLKYVDVVVDAGEIEERQSVVLDFTEKIVKIIKK